MNIRQDAPKVSIRKIPVIPFKISVLCDCGGEFIFKDSPVALHPRVYKHVCNKCGYELLLQESFPQTVYEELTGEPESECEDGGS